MSFNSLSVEILCMIFDELDSVNELLKCRLVSKRCNEAVACMRIESLAIESKFYDRKKFAERIYVFTNQPVNSTSRLLMKSEKVHHRIDFLGSEIMRAMLCTIKQLSINRVILKTKADKTTFQTLINQFVQLDHLQVNFLETVQKKYLFLSNVRIFSVLHFAGNHLYLDAPKLRKLFWFDKAQLVGPERLHLEYPEKLTHLTLPFAKQDDLLKYKNLECLELRDIIGPREKVVSPDSFGKLRELFLEVEFKPIAIKWMKSWRLGRNPDLRLYIYSVPVENRTDIDQLFTKGEGCLYKNMTQFIINNYHKIPKHRIYRIKGDIEYGRLIKHFGDPLPADLCSIRIRNIYVRGPVNQANFIEFLRKCKSPKSLDVENSTLDRTFYSNLIDYSPFLEKICIDQNLHELPESRSEARTFLAELSV